MSKVNVENFPSSEEFIKYVIENHAFNSFKIISANNEIENVIKMTSFLDKMYPENPEISFSQRIYHIRNNINNVLNCPICGNTLNYKKDGYAKTCKNRECVKENGRLKSLDTEISKKRENTTLKRFGVKYSIQNQECNEKRIKTNIERYGTENPSKNQNVIKKMKKTCIEKYGIENYTQTNEFKKKAQKTCIEKYGVKNVMMSEEMQEKAKKTCIEKYGVDYYMKTENFHDHYGKIFHDRMQNDEEYRIANERKQKLKTERVFFDIMEKNNHIESGYKYLGYKNNRKHLILCPNCEKEFLINSMLYSIRSSHNHEICTYCNPINKPYSQQEIEVYEYISSIYENQIIRNSRSIITPFEIDFYLPEIRLAIEYNGDYWHANPDIYKEDEIINIKGIETIACDIWMKDINKLSLLESKGIVTIVVWENDWKNKQQEIKNFIKDVIYS